MIERAKPILDSITYVLNQNDIIWAEDFIQAVNNLPTIDNESLENTRLRIYKELRNYCVYSYIGVEAGEGREVLEIPEYLEYLLKEYNADEIKQALFEAISKEPTAYTNEPRYFHSVQIGHSDNLEPVYFKGLLMYYYQDFDDILDEVESLLSLKSGRWVFEQ